MFCRAGFAQCAVPQVPPESSWRDFFDAEDLEGDLDADLAAMQLQMEQEASAAIAAAADVAAGVAVVADDVEVSFADAFAAAATMGDDVHTAVAEDAVGDKVSPVASVEPK